MSQGYQQVMWQATAPEPSIELQSKGVDWSLVGHCLYTGLPFLAILIMVMRFLITIEKRAMKEQEEKRIFEDPRYVEDRLRWLNNAATAMCSIAPTTQPIFMGKSITTSETSSHKQYIKEREKSELFVSADFGEQPGEPSKGCYETMTTLHSLPPTTNLISAERRSIPSTQLEAKTPRAQKSAEVQERYLGCEDLVRRYIKWQAKQKDKTKVLDWDEAGMVTRKMELCKGLVAALEVRNEALAQLENELEWMEGEAKIEVQQ